MTSHVLITGGAGFIGSHLADELLAEGHRVRVLDSLHPQVHGEGRAHPRDLARDVELIVGDVRNASVVAHVLEGIDVVYHFAARVGVGQSMYAMRDYVDVNDVGTTVLLEALTTRPVGRLIVASSMSVYGEGLYRTVNGELRSDVTRSMDRLRQRLWDPVDTAGIPLVPVPTPETKEPSVSSVYALSKFDQEHLCLIFGRAYGISTLAVRFFNVYGPRQSLSNPYTGVLAIFASRLLNKRRPVVFEDGEQRRDFIHVRDVARACRMALSSMAQGAINIASGSSISIRALAEEVAQAVGSPALTPEITAEYRVGDVRHCFADVRRARDALGFEARIPRAEGLQDFATWLAGQTAQDRVSEARAELAARGLTL